MMAFWDLNTCRQIGMGLGQIPWDKIVEYGYHAGLERVIIDPFVRIIQTMDAKYLNWKEEQSQKDKANRQSKRS